MPGTARRLLNKLAISCFRKLQLRRPLRSSRKHPLCARLAALMKCLSRCGGWQHSTPTNFQYRRGSCRYCWGFGHQYQWRDAVEFEEKLAEALAKKGKEPNDRGGYGYDHTSSPNPKCPRCNGDGIGQPFFADTRKLAPDAALAYSGVKLGKNGVEITAISRERMYEAVMKRLGTADSEFAQRLQQIEIERRQLEIDKLRKELAADPEDDEPTPVAININVVDARVREEDGDSSDA